MLDFDIKSNNLTILEKHEIFNIELLRQGGSVRVGSVGVFVHTLTRNDSVEMRVELHAPHNSCIIFN